MEKILVTGGAGNIGSSLVKALLKRKGSSVYVFDNLLTGKKENLPFKNSNLIFKECNINNITELESAWEDNIFDFVFHYAALVGVSRTQLNPLAVLNDVDGIKNILKMSSATGTKRIFFSSSSEVYGEPVEIPQNEETTPLNSRIPYAIVKNIGEAFFKAYQKENGLDYTILRFFNTYGPNQNNDFVVTRFIEQAVTGEDLTIYGDGQQSRSFLYIDDNVDFTLQILDESLFINDVVNVGSEEVISIKDLAELIKKLTESKSNIVHLPPLEDGDMFRRKPDISKMKKHRTDFLKLEEGIRKLISKI